MKQIETFGNEQNEEKDSVKMSEKTKNILIFYGQLLWCGILLCGVLYVTILLYGLGFIMFWNSFGKSTYKWMDNIWERYTKYVNSVFWHGKCTPKIKRITRVCVDILFAFFIFYGVVCCFGYGLIMFWNSFGKKNQKWLKQMCEWYVNRTSKSISELSGKGGRSLNEDESEEFKDFNETEELEEPDEEGEDIDSDLEEDDK